MNKEFKVGQRVWSKEYKELATVIDDSYFETCRIKFDDGDEHSVFNIDLHQTADDMFEELGYEQFDLNDKRFIEHKNNGDCIQIKDNQIIECLLYSPNIKEKHQAIHQKLIELGLI